jgi:erythromycin esterase-like protein
MREAQEMMKSPEFKKQMKKMQNSKDFKEATKKATDMMKDPGTAARLTAQMEHMVKRGQDTLKKEATNSMKDAFDAFQNPDVMAEAAQMMRDPDFKKNMANMAKDPAFKNYIAAVRYIHHFSVHFRHWSHVVSAGKSIVPSFSHSLTPG